LYDSYETIRVINAMRCEVQRAHRGGCRDEVWSSLTNSLDDVYKGFLRRELEHVGRLVVDLKVAVVLGKELSD